MTNNISIPKPCHEDWNNMSPEQQGRHCMACCKTVVDFTSWDEHKILHYLETRSNEKVCGRFNVSQLETNPEPSNVFPIILKSNISFFKKIAAIVLLCFGVITSTQSSAQEKMGKVKCSKPQVTQGTLLGEPAVISEDSTKQMSVDTTKYIPQIMGMVKQPPKKMPKKPLPKANK